ncbi:MAG: hypothetical protein IPP66_02670 [Anaerolineales bacterium]|nr:hypothetical protein [Anaerolineales bacterium]
MQKALNQFMLLLVIVAVVATSAIRTTTVYADDGSTDPVSESTPTDGEQPVAPTEEQSPVATDPVTVPEILEQLPEDTELVVVNEEGDVEPLATEAAAEIIATADPMWCPEGATPGDASCTSSYSDFASLIAALTADAASATPVYTGNGVIWVEDTYNGNDDSQIILDGAVLTNLNNHNLTVQGGWSGGNNTTVTGTSLADVSMVFVNWTGNITINDFDITAGDDAGFGLSIQNTGTVTLDNVSVNGTTANTYGFGDGAVIDSTGNVDITNSEFDNNAGNGLTVASGGTIDLDTVSASSNTLTGAFLDSCGYGDVTAGLCAGAGAVTVNSGASIFNSNGFNGLVIDAGGGIDVANIQANTNGLNGAVLTSADEDGTGNVTVDQSEFNGKFNGTGLDILTDGTITLTNVDAFSNNTGAILDTTYDFGAINVSDSNFGTDATTGNDWTGLHAESSDTITLLNVVSSYNGSNGAYLEVEGDITITNSSFDSNVNSNFPEDPGLYANSNGGDITLTDVNADNNMYGAGAVLSTGGNGAITVTGGHFNGNGSFGVLAQNEDGDITLNNVTASLNKIKGAYLNSYGLGNIFVNNSVFVENGSFGIYAGTFEGNINLDQVTVTGNDVTGIGAALITETGNIFVSDSTFNLNTAVGLWVATGGQVDLVNVTADGNGVEVYSTSTVESMCLGDEVVNIVVNVDGGVFTNNGEYGLMVKPGPLGTLTFVTPSTFSGNTLGDYLLDISDPESKDCTPVEEPPTETKEPLVVEVPSNGGTPVEQDCELYSGTILKLPNGTWMKVGCPYEGFSLIEDLSEAELPGQLGAGTNFAGGVTVSLLDGEGNVILNEDGTVTINFLIPEDSRGRGYSILFWDPTLNDGVGGWVTLPLFEEGTSFMLNPDNPEDTRTIISGVKQVGNVVTVTVNFSGAFILVER